ncbi:hypothetical protein [Roseateles sp. DB2]|uniref:hypothetical protein n=1 Tax=Roseateles sp. DB2 TaxID=3453717 RepID=UPI003F71CEC1
MKTILALLSAACLCVHGATHAQSTAPAAPKVPLPATAGSKLAAVAAKPGSGQRADGVAVRVRGQQLPRRWKR